MFTFGKGEINLSQFNCTESPIHGESPCPIRLKKLSPMSSAVQSTLNLSSSKDESVGIKFLLDSDKKQMAQDFYKRNLLIRYGIKPWQDYIITLFKKTEQRVSLKALELNPEAEDDVDIIESVTENLESGDQEELPE